MKEIFATLLASEEKKGENFLMMQHIEKWFNVTFSDIRDSEDFLING